MNEFSRPGIEFGITLIKSAATTMRPIVIKPTIDKNLAHFPVSFRNEIELIDSDEFSKDSNELVSVVSIN